jgi:sugar phosphate isomerase/epimerase
MKVGASHLTYCTNIHPGESWAEVRANLEQHVLAVKARVSPDAPFGVGLRLSGRAANELVDARALRRWLDDHGLYVFTINGFPHGAFHATPVKEEVYRPDWREPERVAYSNRLADLLVELLPDGVDGTISTVPGCFQARAGGDAEMAANLARCAEHLAAIEARTGRAIMLALEPEPCCVMETIAQTVAFFDTHAIDRRRIGVCLDVCHAAVEFEDLPAIICASRRSREALRRVAPRARLEPADRDDQRARGARAIGRPAGATDDRRDLRRHLAAGDVPQRRVRSRSTRSAIPDRPIPSSVTAGGVGAGCAARRRRDRDRRHRC